MDELNYYELLDLDPTVEDTPSIEQRIQEKQRLWSRLATEGAPRDARIAARNLRLLDPIRRTMLTPALRAPQAELARRRQDQRRHEARVALTSLLAFAKDKVTDPESFISRDCARYVRELGRAEVQRLVEAAGITARPEQAPPRRESLDPTTARRIRESLDHLGISGPEPALHGPKPARQGRTDQPCPAPERPHRRRNRHRQGVGRAMHGPLRRRVRQGALHQHPA